VLHLLLELGYGKSRVDQQLITRDEIAQRINLDVPYRGIVGFIFGRLSRIYLRDSITTLIDQVILYYRERGWIVPVEAVSFDECYRVNELILKELRKKYPWLRQKGDDDED